MPKGENTRDFRLPVNTGIKPDGFAEDVPLIDINNYVLLPDGSGIAPRNGSEIRRVDNAGIGVPRKTVFFVSEPPDISYANMLCIVANKDGRRVIENSELIEKADLPSPPEIYTGSTFNFADTTITYDGEDYTQIAYTINRTGNIAAATSVKIKTVNGTAVGGVDFTAIDTTLSFASFESSKSGVVVTDPDSANEGKEFTLELYNPGTASRLGSAVIATADMGEDISGYVTLRPVFYRYSASDTITAAFVDSVTLDNSTETLSTVQTEASPSNNLTTKDLFLHYKYSGDTLEIYDLAAIQADPGGGPFAAYRTWTMPAGETYIRVWADSDNNVGILSYDSGTGDYNIRYGNVSSASIPSVAGSFDPETAFTSDYSAPPPFDNGSQQVCTPIFTGGWMLFPIDVSGEPEANTVAGIKADGTVQVFDTAFPPISGASYRSLTNIFSGVIGVKGAGVLIYAKTLATEAVDCSGADQTFIDNIAHAGANGVMAWGEDQADGAKSLTVENFDGEVTVFGSAITNAADEYVGGSGSVRINYDYCTVVKENGADFDIIFRSFESNDHSDKTDTTLLTGIPAGFNFVQDAFGIICMDYNALISDGA